MGLNPAQQSALDELTNAGFNVQPSVMHLLDTLTRAEIDCLKALIADTSKGGTKDTIKAAIFDGVGAHPW